MIFATVGTDQPFDRMIKLLDSWAGAAKGRDVFAQIGRDAWQPRHIEHTDFLGPKEFAAKFRVAEVVVAHAGMGTIISALRESKPIVVMPKQSGFEKVRSDHQLATAKRFEGVRGIHVAYSAPQFLKYLEDIKTLTPPERIPECGEGTLIFTLRRFIQEGWC